MDIFNLVALAIIFAITLFFIWLGIKIGEFRSQKNFEKIMPSLRKDAVEKSRYVLGGQFSEQLAPYLPHFKYNPNDCRFIGKPIDMIIFNGLSNGELKDITFLEIKSGDSKINSNQRDLKKVIEDKKVKFEEYRIPKKLTERKD